MLRRMRIKKVVDILNNFKKKEMVWISFLPFIGENSSDLSNFGIENFHAADPTVDPLLGRP